MDMNDAKKIISSIKKNNLSEFEKIISGIRANKIGEKVIQKQYLKKKIVKK
jgi:hypothetical protein